MSPREALKTEARSLPSQLTEVIAVLSPELQALVDQLPNSLLEVLKDQPIYSDRASGSILLRRYIIPASPRSLEVWPLPWQRANGRAVTPTIALFAVAHNKLRMAPVIMGGKRTATKQAAA
jgi:hypothetical protein